jgi:5'-3' exonuclease
MIALIDGDVVVYRVGFASDSQTEVQNCINCDLVMKDILNATQAESYKVFLSDSLVNNFRYAIDNNYKANRKNAPRPRWYDSLRLFLKNEYNAEITLGQEADDALGIEQTRYRYWAMRDKYAVKGTMLQKSPVSVICSIDKDLLQVPGEHYNITKGERTTVTPIDGIRSFYTQLLVGDTVDNIVGIRGIGPVKAGRLLDGLTEERDLFETVRRAYGDDHRLLKNGRLLWVRRVENELWGFPNVEKERVGVGGEGDSGREIPSDREVPQHRGFGEGDCEHSASDNSGRE